MGLLKNIEWTDSTKNTIVYKFPIGNDQVNKGSNLTVREGQACVFCHQGKMADVFLPGRYKLDTDNIPFLTKLMGWKYGFENPFRSDIYFVNTTQFTNLKWGTMNPVIVRDKDYGAIRIRGYGSYSFKVEDPFVFMTQLSGSHSTYKTEEITDYLKSTLIMGLTDAIGESKLPILDMAANLMELSKVVQTSLQADFSAIGVTITKFNFENFSLPEELEKAFDTSASLGMRRSTIDVEMQLAQAEALKEAAKNPGAGGVMGAGMGMGMGLGMGNMFGNMMGNNLNAQQVANNNKPTGAKCAKCGASMQEGAKFCPECGSASGAICPKCKAVVTNPNAKFCPECGASMAASCPKCGASVKAGAKFCPECGEKL